MHYKFTAYGHPNILATHKTTLEFTKNNELSLRGDCIVGVKADFDLNKIKEFTKKINNKTHENLRFSGHQKSVSCERVRVKCESSPLARSSQSSLAFDGFFSEITITIKTISNTKKIQEKIDAELNPNFKSNTEFVVRKTDFASERTFAIRANKAAIDLNRDLIEFLRDERSKISVIIENKE